MFGNVVSITAMIRTLSRSSSCYATLMQTANIDSVTSLIFTLFWRRHTKKKRLLDQITPRCYGAFEGDGMNVLILELCDGILMDWDELNDSER